MQCFPLFTLLLALGSPTVDFLSLDIEVFWVKYKCCCWNLNSHIRAQSWRCWRQFLGQRFVVLSNLHKLWWHPKCLNHANIINSGGHSGHQRRNRVSFLGQKVLSLNIRGSYSFTFCDDCSLGKNSSTFSPPMATHTSLLLPGGSSCLSINKSNPI